MKYVAGICMIVLLASGCSMKQPQTAQEFRQMAPQSMFGTHETFDINNPYSTALANFKKRAGKCLTGQVERTTTNQYGQVMSTMTLTYTPTLITGKTKSELHVQQAVEGAITVGQVPEKGFYMLVADLSSAGRNKTRLEMFRSMGTDTMARAVKNWASGENLGCPDLTAE